ncbi:MAG: lysophospholipid acyltransferase family protein [Pyrinomonadaceae bacterium]
MLIRIADRAFYVAIKLIGSTIRWETIGQENLDALKADGRQPIYCLWHDRIFAGTYYLRDRGIVVITSQSLDGEYIARFLKRFGFGTVRGSSSRGGVKALVEMIRHMRNGLPMAFTVDGPRGPRYAAKPGPIILAKKTGNPILPFSVACSRFWTINSWDRMQIPKPFTRARFIIGEPVYVPAETNDGEIENKRIELQEALETLVKTDA